MKGKGKGKGKGQRSDKNTTNVAPTMNFNLQRPKRRKTQVIYYIYLIFLFIYLIYLFNILIYLFNIFIIFI